MKEKESIPRFFGKHYDPVADWWWVKVTPWVEIAFSRERVEHVYFFGFNWARV